MFKEEQEDADGEREAKTPRAPCDPPETKEGKKDSAAPSPGGARLSQAQKNKVAANRTRALKKRNVAQEAKRVERPQWNVTKAPELREDEVKPDEKAATEVLDPGEADAIREQLKAFEKRLAEEREITEKAEVRRKADECAKGSQDRDWPSRSVQGARNAEAGPSESSENEEEAAVEDLEETSSSSQALRKAHCDEHLAECKAAEERSGKRSTAKPVVSPPSKKRTLGPLRP